MEIFFTHHCGEVMIIESKEFPDLFELKKPGAINGTCTNDNCPDKSITITSDDIVNAKKIKKWEWHWEDG